MRRPIVNGLVFLAAIVVADLGVYQRALVPRLGAWPSVPLIWWVGIVAPVAVAVGAIGVLARSHSEVRRSAAVAAVGGSLYLFWAAQSGQPGHLKGLAVEDPWAFWAFALALTFALVALPASIICWARSAR